jgi:hypothetical protein
MSNFNQIQTCRQTSVKLTNIKIYKNPFSSSGDVGRADKAKKYWRAFTNFLSESGMKKAERAPMTGF